MDLVIDDICLVRDSLLSNTTPMLWADVEYGIILLFIMIGGMTGWLLDWLLDWLMSTVYLWQFRDSELLVSHIWISLMKLFILVILAIGFARLQ